MNVCSPHSLSHSPPSPSLSSPTLLSSLPLFSLPLFSSSPSSLFVSPLYLYLLSLSALQDNTKADHGFSSGSQAVQFLYSVMSEFTETERRQFLQFVTGSPRLPISGFKGLTPKYVTYNTHPATSHYASPIRLAHSPVRSASPHRTTLPPCASPYTSLSTPHIAFRCITSLRTTSIPHTLCLLTLRNPC